MSGPAATKWITSGPQFWLTKLLQRENRALSTRYIWQSVQTDSVQDIIPTKRFLKLRVINAMQNMGNLERAKATDVTSKALRNGWILVPEKAFKYIHPDLRAADAEKQIENLS